MNQNHWDRRSGRFRGATGLVLKGNDQIDGALYKLFRGFVGCLFVGQVAPVELNVFFLPRSPAVLTPDEATPVTAGHDPNRREISRLAILSSPAAPQRKKQWTIESRQTGRKLFLCSSFPPSRLPNHPIRPHQHIRRNRQTDLLGGFETARREDRREAREFFWDSIEKFAGKRLQFAV
jgi:hypothetical protein